MNICIVLIKLMVGVKGRIGQIVKVELSVSQRCQISRTIVE